MGFSVSGSFAILVLASFVAFGMLYSAGANGVERVTEATSASHEDRLLTANTDIEIAAANYQNGTLELEAINRGTTTLSLGDTDLLVDNQYQRRTDLETFQVPGEPDSELWLPNETLQIRVDVSSPERVKLVTEHGVADATVVS